MTDHKKFLDDVEAKLLSCGTHVYYKPFNFRIHDQRLSVEMIAYKTVFVCREGLADDFKHSGEYANVVKKVQLVKRNFTNYQIFVVHRSAYSSETDPDYDLSIPQENIVHIDSIQNMIGKIPKESFFIGYCDPFFSFVSSLNTGPRYEYLYPQICTTQKVIDRCREILEDEEEKERFENILQQINPQLVETDMAPLNSVILATCNSLSFFARYSQQSFTIGKNMDRFVNMTPDNLIYLLKLKNHSLVSGKKNVEKIKKPSMCSISVSKFAKI